MRSPAMQEAVHSLHAAIAGTGGVLLCGEPGTGRVLFARAIHHATHSGFDGSIARLLRYSMQVSPSDGRFVVVDCAERDSLERGLFGITCPFDRAPADELDRISDNGALFRALKGTLVLRQVPEMPVRLQARLARLLRDGEAWLHRENGSTVRSPIECRPIAIAETGSDQLVPDLRRRLAQQVIEVPPLCRRREDIPVLVRLLLADLCAAEGRPRKVASPQAAELLAALPWRGNLCELEDLLRALVDSVPGRLVRLAHVLSHVRLDGARDTFVYSGTLKEARERFEREYVAHVLDQHRGRMAEAAKALGIQRTNLYRKVRQLSVTRRPRGRFSRTPGQLTRQA